MWLRRFLYQKSAVEKNASTIQIKATFKAKFQGVFDSNSICQQLCHKLVSWRRRVAKKASVVVWWIFRGESFSPKTEIRLETRINFSVPQLSSKLKSKVTWELRNAKKSWKKRIERDIFPVSPAMERRTRTRTGTRWTKTMTEETNSWLQ